MWNDLINYDCMGPAFEAYSAQPQEAGTEAIPNEAVASFVAVRPSLLGLGIGEAPAPRTTFAVGDYAPTTTEPRCRLGHQAETTVSLSASKFTTAAPNRASRWKHVSPERALLYGSRRTLASQRV